MTTISLTPVPLTPKVLVLLEKRKLIRRLVPTRKVLATRTKTGAVDTFYSSLPAYGGHKLMAIGKRATRIQFSTHPDNEEFLLINPSGLRFKPLYLVLGLEKGKRFEKRLKDGTIRNTDLLAVELAFNDPKTCVFTMCKGTPHCEVTVPGKGMHPVFFVAEPSRLPSRKFTARGYNFEIQERA